MPLETLWRDHESVEVALPDDLDMMATFRLEPEVYRLLTQHGVRRLVLNLADVEFVDSAGVGALVSIREQADRFGVELWLANVSDAVQRVLDITGVGSSAHHPPAPSPTR